jgi:hypothetical protein
MAGSVGTFLSYAGESREAQAFPQIYRLTSLKRIPRGTDIHSIAGGGIWLGGRLYRGGLHLYAVKSPSSAVTAHIFPRDEFFMDYQHGVDSLTIAGQYVGYTPDRAGFNLSTVPVYSNYAGLALGPPAVSAQITILVLPFWLFAAVGIIAAVLPYFTGVRRKSVYRCVQCGYDIHVTPGRCPECGSSSRDQTAPEKGAPEKGRLTIN